MAFFRKPKLPTKKAPLRPWTNKEIKVVGWCMNKRIQVGITPDWKHEYNLWQIEIRINGTSHHDPKRYDDDVLDKVYEYYKYYYDKYNKQQKIPNS